MRQWISHHWFRYWLVASSAPSHYLNQCWLIVNSTLRNKLQWNFNRNLNIFIQENAFENNTTKVWLIFKDGDCLRICISVHNFLTSYCMKRHENMPPCTGNRVKSNYEWIASRVGAQLRTWASETQRYVPPLSVVSHVYDLAIIRLTAKWIEALGLILYLDGWSLVYNSSAILRMPFVATSGRDKSSEQWSIVCRARCLYSKHPFKNDPSCMYSYLPTCKPQILEPASRKLAP